MTQRDNVSSLGILVRGALACREPPGGLDTPGHGRSSLRRELWGCGAKLRGMAPKGLMMIFQDRYGFPVECIRGRWFTNFIRLLLHTRRIKRGVWWDSMGLRVEQHLEAAISTQEPVCANCGVRDVECGGTCEELQNEDGRMINDEARDGVGL